MRQPAVWLVVGFIIWQGISLLWTPNVLRGVLTLSGISGMLGLVFVACLASVTRIALLPALAKLYIVTALIMACLAIAQFILGIWLSRQDTLLCAGCVADQFGFCATQCLCDRAAVLWQYAASLYVDPSLCIDEQATKLARVAVVRLLVHGARIDAEAEARYLHFW